jgi:hypothetical protein
MTYPTLEFNYNYSYLSSAKDTRDFKLLVDNVWHAQMAGCPKILTYSGPRLSRGTRSAAMHFELGGAIEEIPHILSRDEYPFACTREGGASSFVGHVPGHQNSVQGGKIAAFVRQNNISPGSRFIVRVLNHPRGPVTSFCKNRGAQPCPGCTKARCLAMMKPMP